jgi:hypothetical protein
MATDNKYKVGDIVIWDKDRSNRGIIVESYNNNGYNSIYWFRFKQCLGYSFDHPAISLLKEAPDVPDGN